MLYLAYREDDPPSLLTPLHICITIDDILQELYKVRRKKYARLLTEGGRRSGFDFLNVCWIKLQRSRATSLYLSLDPAYVLRLPHLQRRCWHCRPGYR